MDIEQFAYKVIEKIKALPPYVKQTGPDSGLKTVWDEFKCEKQFQNSDSFSLFENLIQSLVENKIKQEDDFDVEILHYLINRKQYSHKKTAVKRNEVINKVLCQIHIKAQDEELEWPENFKNIVSNNKVEERRRRLKKCYYTLVLAKANLRGISFIDALGETRCWLELKKEFLEH